MNKKVFCNLLEGYKKINEQDDIVRESKESNILRRNCMKTKQELEKAIKDTIIKYREIIFGADNPICIKYLDELLKQQVIDESVYD